MLKTVNRVCSPRLSSSVCSLVAGSLAGFHELWAHMLTRATSPLQAMSPAICVQSASRATALMHRAYVNLHVRPNFTASRAVATATRAHALSVCLRMSRCIVRTCSRWFVRCLVPPAANRAMRVAVYVRSASTATKWTAMVFVNHCAPRNVTVLRATNNSARVHGYVPNVYTVICTRAARVSPPQPVPTARLVCTLAHDCAHWQPECACLDQRNVSMYWRGSAYFAIVLLNEVELMRAWFLCDMFELLPHCPWGVHRQCRCLLLRPVTGYCCSTSPFPNPTGPSCTTSSWV